MFCVIAWETRNGLWNVRFLWPSSWWSSRHNLTLVDYSVLMTVDPHLNEKNLEVLQVYIIDVWEWDYGICFISYNKNLWVGYIHLIVRLMNPIKNLSKHEIKLWEIYYEMGKFFRATCWSNLNQYSETVCTKTKISNLPPWVGPHISACNPLQSIYLDSVVEDATTLCNQDFQLLMLPPNVNARLAMTFSYRDRMYNLHHNAHRDWN